MLQRAVAFRRLGKLKEALEEIEFSLKEGACPGKGTHPNKSSWFPQLPLNFVVVLLVAELKDELKGKDLIKPTNMSATSGLLNDLISCTNSQIYSYSSIDLAKQQAVHLVLANLFICMGHWRLTLGVLTKARCLIKLEIKVLTSTSALNLLLSWRCSSLDYYIGCVFLQLGCTNAAIRAFGCACKWAQLRGLAQGHATDFGRRSHVVNYSCSCLVLFTKGLYSNALQTQTTEKPILLSHCLIPTASELINNQAICALYSCDLEFAIYSIEAAVWSYPLGHLCEVTVFNLCTLYDLSSNNKSAIKRKRKLQGFAIQHGVRDIDGSLFRISG